MAFLPLLLGICTGAPIATRTLDASAPIAVHVPKRDAQGAFDIADAPGFRLLKELLEPIGEGLLDDVVEINPLGGTANVRVRDTLLATRKTA